MMVPELQTLAQIFAERLLNTAVEGFILAALLWGLLHLVGRQNSGTRFAIWFSALLAIVVLPLLPGSTFIASHFRELPAANLRGQIILPSFWGLCLFVGWTAVAGLLLFRLTVGMWRVRHLRRSCRNVDLGTLDPAIVSILRESQSRRRVKLSVSSEVAVPAAIGFLRPTIVFPAWLLSRLSTAEIKVIVLHELAHLRRWDDWTNLVQKIVKAVFFFHPGVWWIENRLTLEREMACDEMVLAQTASPRAYASSLISFAEKLQNARALALAQALVSRVNQISLRVAQILDEKRPRGIGLRKPVLGLSAAMLALALGAAPYMPRVVAFQTIQPRQSLMRHTQVAQRAVKGEAQPIVVRTATSRSVVKRVAQVLQPREIPAAFNPRSPMVAPPLKSTSPRKPLVIRAKASQEELAFQDTIVVVQATQDDASGVWTFCIWKIGGKSLAERQLQSANVVGSI